MTEQQTIRGIGPVKRPGQPGRQGGAWAKWEFYTTVAKVGIPAAALGGLVYYAAQGVILAVAILAALGALLFVGIGVFAALAIQDRQLGRERIRFQDNTAENLALMQKIQDLQNAQALGQARINNRLLNQGAKLSANGQPADIDALDWPEGLEIDHG